MKLFWVSLLVVMLVFATSVQAMRLADNMYFTMLPGSEKCFDVMIPDDLRTSSTDKIDYVITSTAPREWSDVTGESVITTDENNRAVLPVCFFSYGKGEGECSDPYTITLSAPVIGVSRNFAVGVCVSEHGDIDIEEIGNEGVEDVINSNVDFFDVGFETGIVYPSAGETVQIKGFVQSYGDFVIDVEASMLTPSSTSVITSESDPLKEIDFTFQAPASDGEYEIILTANIQGCEDDLCTKTAKLDVIVGSDASGFTVSIFPRTINIKKLMPVLCRATIENNGETAVFETGIVLSPDLASTFQPETVTIEGGSRKIITFLVTPQTLSSLNEIKVTATSAGVMKYDVSHLSVNEMQTDVARQALSNTGLENEVNEWLQEYETTDYGEDLDSYRSLQDIFASGTANDTNEIVDENGGGSFDYTWIIIAVVIVIAVLIVVVMFRKHESGKYFTPESPQTPLRILQALQTLLLRQRFSCL